MHLLRLALSTPEELRSGKIISCEIDGASMHPTAARQLQNEIFRRHNVMVVAEQTNAFSYGNLVVVFGDTVRPLTFVAALTPLQWDQ
jgi:hypothetical protein